MNSTDPENMKKALPKPRLKLKTLHDQIREIKPNKNASKLYNNAQNSQMDDPEIIDSKILEMINKNNDLIYDDDYEYFQYFGKKKLDESSWKLLSKEDEVKWKSLRQKYVKKIDKETVLLERDISEGDQKRQEQKEDSGAFGSFLGVRLRKKESQDGGVEDGVEKQLKVGDGEGGVVISSALVDYSDDDSDEESKE